MTRRHAAGQRCPHVDVILRAAVTNKRPVHITHFDSRLARSREKLIRHTPEGRAYRCARGARTRKRPTGEREKSGTRKIEKE